MKAALVALLCAVLLAAAGCGDDSSPGRSSRPGGAPATGAISTVQAARARAELAGLRPIARRMRPDYRRDAFGQSWHDTDHNGCNQRDDVLLRDAVPGTVTTGRQGACDHDVLAGTWVDPYTGHRITLDDAKDLAQSQQVQIDHVVPLAEAWSSGAAGWTAPRRLGFANDLRNLLAVDGPTNAGKGADDPAAWRPRKAFQCAYAVRWVSVKDRWDLGADPSEVRALREMLGFCP
ncbi:MAG TPA: HNH endonuclease family protein [Nocardioides sp.]|nr:HNH endonuclease family protein [Nocardioides sp.]